MKRSLLISALLSVSVTACGEKPPPSPAPAAAPVTAPAPAPDAAKVERGKESAAPADAMKNDAMKK